MNEEQLERICVALEVIADELGRIRSELQDESEVKRAGGSEPFRGQGFH